MKEQLISFSAAKLAKQKGLCEYFKNINSAEYVPAFYSEDGLSYEETEFKQEDCIINDRYFRATQFLLQAWLRNEHKIEIAVQWFDKGYIKAVKKQPFKNNTYRMETWNSYEDALEAALFEALNLIQNEG